MKIENKGRYAVITADEGCFIVRKSADGNEVSVPCRRASVPPGDVGGYTEITEKEYFASRRAKAVEKLYADKVRAIIRGRFSTSEEIALINNYIAAMQTPATFSSGEDARKADRHMDEYSNYMSFRQEAKRIALEEAEAEIDENGDIIAGEGDEL